MSVSLEDHIPAYSVVAANSKFEVVNRSQRTILVCADQRSAEHNATLMNDAFTQGYKACLKDRRNQ